MNGIDPEMLKALASLSPDAVVTLQVRAGDLAAAYGQALPGPEVYTPQLAAQYVGWTAAQWAAWCRQGRVLGAVKEGRGWIMPKDGVRALVNWKLRRPVPGDELSRRRWKRGPWTKKEGG